jgi:hypothetical protein
MPFFWKMRKCCTLRKNVIGITEFFIFCIMKVFSGAIKYAKFGVLPRVEEFASQITSSVSYSD